MLFRKIFVCFLIPMFLFCASQVFAQELETINGIPVSTGYCTNNKEYVQVRYYDLNSLQMIDFSVPYSDEYFEREDDIFYQDLAQASLGMATSAFRKGLDGGTAPDTNILSFFQEIGFDHIQSCGYNTDPTETSFACVIAEKKIHNTTVVAFIGCGAGYNMEWVSNLTVGTGEEHEGFSTAVSICEDRLKTYLKENKIDGNVRLWISGFSRAS